MSAAKAEIIAITNEPAALDFVERCLRELYPHGHEGYIPLLLDEAKLHSEKNHDYAGPGGNDPLGNFKRRAAIYAFYPGLDPADPAVVAIIDLMKQLDAYLWFKSAKHSAKVEGKDTRLRDVTVYADLARLLDREADDGHAGSSPADY